MSDPPQMERKWTRLVYPSSQTNQKKKKKKKKKKKEKKEEKEKKHPAGIDHILIIYWCRILIFIQELTAVDDRVNSTTEEVQDPTTQPIVDLPEKSSVLHN